MRGHGAVVSKQVDELAGSIRLAFEFSALTPQPFRELSKFVYEAGKDQRPQQDLFADGVEPVQAAFQAEIAFSSHRSY